MIDWFACLDTGPVNWSAVQALGSVGAILVAVIVAWFSQRGAIKIFLAQGIATEIENRRKARSLALLLMPELIRMENWLQPEQFRKMLSGAELVPFAELLNKSVERHYLMGDAGDEVTKSLAMLNHLFEMVEVGRGKPGRDPQIEPYCAATREQLAWAIQNIKPIHDAGPKSPPIA